MFNRYYGECTRMMIEKEQEITISIEGVTPISRKLEGKKGVFQNDWLNIKEYRSRLQEIKK